MCRWPCCHRTVAKYDPANGEIVWYRDHGADCYCIAVDSADNIYTGGDPADTGETVRVYDPDGHSIMSIATGGSIYGIAVDGSGNIYVTGERVAGKSLWKFDPTGTLVWAVDHGGTGFCLAIEGSHLYLGGQLVDGAALDGSTLVNFRKYDLGGGLVWSQNNGGAFSVDATDAIARVYYAGVSTIAADASGNVYAGTGLVSTGSEYDILRISGSTGSGTFKLQWNGVKTTALSHNANADQVRSAMAAVVHNHGNVFTGGGPLPADLYLNILTDASELPTSLIVTDSTLGGGAFASVQILNRGKNRKSARAWSSSGDYLGGRNSADSALGGTTFAVDAAGNLWSGSYENRAVGAHPGFSKWSPSGTLLQEFLTPVPGIQSWMTGLAVTPSSIFALSSCSMAFGGAASGFPGLFRFTNAATPVKVWSAVWSSIARLPPTPQSGFPYRFAANGLALGADGYPVVCGIRV